MTFWDFLTETAGSGGDLARVIQAQLPQLVNTDTVAGMARSIREISKEIQALSRSEKEGLLGALVADLDVASDPEIDAAWLEEARRRGKEIDDGTVKCVPAADVFKRLDTFLKK